MHSNVELQCEKIGYDRLIAI